MNLIVSTKLTKKTPDLFIDVVGDAWAVYEYGEQTCRQLDVFETLQEARDFVTSIRGEFA